MSRIDPEYLAERVEAGAKAELKRLASELNGYHSNLQFKIKDSYEDAWSHSVDPEANKTTHKHRIIVEVEIEYVENDISKKSLAGPAGKPRTHV